MNTFIATAPNGKQIQRNSKRDYKFAVLANDEGDWKFVSFNSSLELASKELSRITNDFPAIEFVVTELEKVRA